MLKPQTVKALFLDIGGVLLTNGWDTLARQQAAVKFNLDYEQLNERHHLVFDAYESGKISLANYLESVVFYEPRDFPLAIFQTFMLEQSHALPEMIEWIPQLKARFNFKIVAVNNEGRELNQYRIRQFNLDSFIDLFVSSCYVHIRKPDPELYHLAMEIAHVSAEEVIYLDDRLPFVEAARRLGICGIHHTSASKTRQQFEKVLA